MSRPSPAVLPTIIGVVVGAIIVVAVALYLQHDDRSAGSNAPFFSTLADVSAAVRQAGLGCEDFVDNTNDSSSNEFNFGTDYSAARGECTIEGEPAKLELYRDRGAQSNQRGQALALVCSFGKAFGITSFVFVEGNQWMVAPKTETVARDVAARVGGNAEVHTCS